MRSTSHDHERERERAMTMVYILFVHLGRIESRWSPCIPSRWHQNLDFAEFVKGFLLPRQNKGIPMWWFDFFCMFRHVSLLSFWSKSQAGWWSLEHDFYFFQKIGNVMLSQLTNSYIFQRGRTSTTDQSGSNCPCWFEMFSDVLVKHCHKPHVWLGMLSILRSWAKSPWSICCAKPVPATSHRGALRARRSGPPMRPRPCAAAARWRRQGNLDELEWEKACERNG